MSLAEKLYRIGECVTKEDIKDIYYRTVDKDLEILRIDFLIKNGNFQSCKLHHDVKISSVFRTKKLGGTSDSYYLYPDIELRKEKDVYKKYLSLSYTIKKSILQYASEENKKLAKLLLDNMEQENIRESLAQKSGDFLLVLTLNGLTFYETMKEVFDNWYDSPVNTYLDSVVSGIDTLSNKKQAVGYNPDVKFFTYDNYHKDYQHRIIENFPLSSESAKYIYRGWQYTIAYLRFEYNELEYLIIPSYIRKNQDEYQKILQAFKDASLEIRLIQDSRSSLKIISKNEKALRRQLDTKKQEKPKHRNLLDIGEIANVKTELDNELNKILLEKVQLEDKIFSFENGSAESFIYDIEQKLSHENLSSFLNSISLNILFLTYNTTNFSVEKIYGSLEDILPSKISDVKGKMRNHNIVDGIKLKNKDYAKTYLQDYFARFELQAKFSKTMNEKNVQNMIFKERIYLAKLLLSDEQIDYDNLLNRFEDAREFDYGGKKRIDDKGIKEWLENPKQFLSKEQQVIEFLKSIESLKGVEYGG